MRTLTRDELSNSIQDYDAWVIDVNVASMNLDIKKAPYDSSGKLIYTYSVKGRVKFSSEKHDIDVSFEFLAEGSGFTYEEAFNVYVFSVGGTYGIAGFKLVDSLDRRLGYEDIEKALILALSWYNWEVDVRKKIPVLPKNL